MILRYKPHFIVALSILLLFAVLHVWQPTDKEMAERICNSLFREINVREKDTFPVSDKLKHSIGDAYPAPQAALIRVLLMRDMTIEHHTFYKVCKLKVADTSRVIGYGILGFTIYKPVDQKSSKPFQLSFP